MSEKTARGGEAARGAEDEPPGRSVRPPAMADVARVAGVSHQTVSRVINNSPAVTDATRRRVQEAIVSLGYRPNSAARALVTRRSQTIGVVVVDAGYYGPSTTVLEIEKAAREAGYWVALASLERAGESSMVAALEHFLGLGVEGIVVIAPHAEADRAVEAFADSVPTVMIAAGTHMPRGTVRFIGIDQQGGAASAVRHLVELGHRRVAHVAGPLDWFDASERAIGWAKELPGSTTERSPMLRGDWTAASGYARGLDLVAMGAHRPTAVFCANDQMAIGVLHAFWDHGIRVPAEVSVVGFDDIPAADHVIPPLTTVRQDVAGLGRSCIGLLRKVIAGSPARPVGPVDTELMVRSSTAPPSEASKQEL